MSNAESEIKEAADEWLRIKGENKTLKHQLAEANADRDFFRLCHTNKVEIIKELEQKLAVAEGLVKEAKVIITRLSKAGDMMTSNQIEWLENAEKLRGGK